MHNPEHWGFSPHEPLCPCGSSIDGSHCHACLICNSSHPTHPNDIVYVTSIFTNSLFMKYNHEIFSSADFTFQRWGGRVEVDTVVRLCCQKFTRNRLENLVPNSRKPQWWVVRSGVTSPCTGCSSQILVQHEIAWKRDSSSQVWVLDCLGKGLKIWVLHRLLLGSNLSTSLGKKVSSMLEIFWVWYWMCGMSWWWSELYVPPLPSSRVWVCNFKHVFAWNHPSAPNVCASREKTVNQIRLVWGVLHRIVTVVWIARQC
jgi:ferredoxin